MTKSVSSGFVQVELAAGNLARIRELVAEFQAAADRRRVLVNTPGHSKQDWERITREIEFAGYKLVGALQGSLRL